MGLVASKNNEEAKNNEKTEKSEEFNLTQYKIGTEEFFNNALKYLSENRSSQGLHFLRQYDNLSDDQLIKLMSALKTNNVIAEIDLKGVTIRKPVSKAIIEMLKRNQSVTSINFEETNINGKHLKLIDAMLRKNLEIAGMSDISDDEVELDSASNVGFFAKIIQWLKSNCLTSWLFAQKDVENVNAEINETSAASDDKASNYVEEQEISLTSSISSSMKNNDQKWVDSFGGSKNKVKSILKGEVSDEGLGVSVVK